MSGKPPPTIAIASLLFAALAVALALSRRAVAAPPVGIRMIGEATLPELADPYLTFFRNTVVLSGTAQYSLHFLTLNDFLNSGPFQVVWNQFFLADGTPMATDRAASHSWDMKPVLWSRTAPTRLWDEAKDRDPPLVVWYGGHMRPFSGVAPVWPRDNFSRDVFAFVEKEPGMWFSQEESIFARRADWPRPVGNYLGHRYGHQIVMLDGQTPVVFYEEVTEVRSDGSPAITRIFMDTMEGPFKARGTPLELVDPVNPASGKPYPSTVREDGAALVEGPLYFRFKHKGVPWEAIGFSSGSYYSNYTMNFAARKISDGRRGKPYLLDLTDDGTDLHDAGASLRDALKLFGGPGRPAVVVKPDGSTLNDAHQGMEMLFHGYRKDIRPDTRAVFAARLRVKSRSNGSLRFNIAAQKKPWVRSLPRYRLGKARKADALQTHNTRSQVQPTVRAPRVCLARVERADGNPAETHARRLQPVLCRRGDRERREVDGALSPPLEPLR